MLFQKYVSADACKLEEATRVISLLMQGLALHAVEGEQLEYERFRESVLASIAAFESNPSGQLLMTAGSVLKQLEEYNRHTTKVLRAQARERQAMITMLSQTLLRIGSVNERAATRLQEIESKLEKASEIDDVRTLRIRLGECLENIRDSRSQHQADAQAVMEGVRSQMSDQGMPLPDPSTAAGIPDPVTGLPDMRSALGELEAAQESAPPRYLAVFAANRLRAINARFGYAVGDLVLNAVREQIALRVSAEDRLFRWRGPCIVALLERHEPLPAIQREVGRIGGFRLDKTVEIGSRMILLPVSCVSTVIPVDLPAHDVANQVDAFVAAAEPAE